MQWLDEALSSISNQSWRDSLEVSIFNDASTVSIESVMSMFIIPIIIIIKESSIKNVPYIGGNLSWANGNIRKHNELPS